MSSSSESDERNGGNGSEEGERFSPARIGLQLAAGVLALILLVATLALFFRSEIAELGRAMVDRYGLGAMGVGAFAADALRVPLPPQFYMIAAIAAEAPAAATVAVISLGSAAGGLVTFGLGRRASSLPFVERKIAPVRRRLERLLARYGKKGAWAVAALPLSYWWLCAGAGALQAPYRAYGVIAILRVLRLVATYWILAATWQAGEA